MDINWWNIVDIARAVLMLLVPAIIIIKAVNYFEND